MRLFHSRKLIFSGLSQAGIEEPLREEETDSLTGHDDIPYLWPAWVHFILFGVGVSERAEHPAPTGLDYRPHR